MLTHSPVYRRVAEVLKSAGFDSGFDNGSWPQRDNARKLMWEQSLSPHPPLHSNVAQIMRPAKLHVTSPERFTLTPADPATPLLVRLLTAYTQAMPNLAATISLLHLWAHFIDFPVATPQCLALAAIAVAQVSATLYLLRTIPHRNIDTL